eukprot:TRINITY_DN1726_c0_g1_i1.p1 TRINITY_DN1726_c0_g1~~TRINITY_DN1726_c0_g1_i1.p1  ORF type:complete len:640 (-),score=165.62 TRINITY_DN1726_c0_g1_i1:208-2127(-)
MASSLALVTNADGYDDVATRLKPSAEACWDMPSGSLVEVIDRWAECEYKKHKGFIKAKNLPGVDALKPGDTVDVKDSFPSNTETCMRRHAEQDATKGNVLCFVPNAAAAVKLVEVWVECRWRDQPGFVKARHLQAAPPGASLDAPPMAGGAAAAAALPARGGAKADAAASTLGKKPADADAPIEESPAKKAKTAPAVRSKCKYGGKCYQKNADHLSKFSHPGDADWDAPGAPAPKRLKCKYGEKCYLKHADHRARFAHPGDADWETDSCADDVKKPSDTAAASSSTAAPPSGGEEASAVAPAAVAPPAAAPAADAAAPAAAPAIPAAAPSAAGGDVAAAATTAPAAPAAAAPVGGGDAVRDCDCCFDSVSTSGGAACPAKTHFFCAACLTNFLVAFKTADYAEQKKGKGRALCPMKDSDTPFADGALVPFVPQEVFDEYLDIRIKVAEKSIQEQIEKEHSAKITDLKEKLAAAKGEGEQLELDKHRLRIIDDIFTLKCPRCKLAFLDYDNCSALKCAGCACGFCSFCLADCGKDAHAHFNKNKGLCPSEGGKLFCDHKLWLDCQRIRKTRLLYEYLATLPDALRAKVSDLLAPDAKDLSIDMPENLDKKALTAAAADLKVSKAKGKAKGRGRGRGRGRG